MAGLRLEDHDLPLDGDGGRSRRRKTHEQGEGAEEEPHWRVVASAEVGTICPWRASARLVGINHVALEVGDLDEALEFYGRIFDIQVESRIPGMAFISDGRPVPRAGEGRTQPPDDDRHFGLVVDDKEAALAAARDAGVEMFGKGNDFRDPWGNFIQVVEYSEIQFTKAPRGAPRYGFGRNRQIRSRARGVAPKGSCLTAAR